jgi:hypothetical protein
MESIRGRGTPTSEVEADAIDLLRSRERYQPPPGQKQRVRARILERRVDAGRVRSRQVFGVAIAAALAFGVVGTSVALGRHWIARSYHALAGQMRSPSERPTLPPANVDSAARAPLAVAPPVVQTPSPSETTSDAPPRAPSSPSMSNHAARVPSEDERLVFDAMRALRQEGQPDKAARALDDYLRRHPQGELAEEALALSIEAALVRSDPRAKDMANRYLAMYPKGRFRQVAERARARLSP